MRNTGWYIPYWRKIKKKGKQEKPNTETVSRSEEQLESVRRRWIERYRRTLRSLRVMGLSVGSNRGDVQARYNHLREAGTVRPNELEESYRYLMRVLPPPERRRRRPQADNSAQTSAALAAPPEFEGVIAVEVYTETVELVIGAGRDDVDVEADDSDAAGDEYSDDDDTYELLDAESEMAESEMSLPREHTSSSGSDSDWSPDL